MPRVSNWPRTIDRSCYRVVLAGFFWLPLSYYLVTSYGDIARFFYWLILLPCLLALPLWLRHFHFLDRHILVFIIPVTYLALSTFWVADDLFDPARGQWYYCKRLLFLIALLLAAWRIGRQEDFLKRYLYKCFVVVGMTSAALALWFYQPGAEYLGDWARLSGISVHHDINVSATLFGLNMLFCAYGVIYWKRSWLAVIAPSMLLSLAALLLSQSKIPLLCAIVAVAWLLLHGWRNSYRWRLAILLMSAVLVMVAAAFLVYFQRIPFLDRTESYSIRMELWRSAIEQARPVWLFGHGVGSEASTWLQGKPYYSHAHNFILDTYLYGGLIGALLVAGQCFYTARVGIRRALRDHTDLPLAIWFVTGSLFLLTNGQQPLVKVHHIWFFYWIPAALILTRRDSPDSKIVAGKTG